MIEISIIRNNEVIYEKEFGNYVKKLKNTIPNAEVMRKMENRFLDLVSKDKKIAYYYKIAMGVGTSLLTTSTVAYAEPLGQVSDKLRTITSPVMDLLAGMGYPITYGMLITGFIMITMGKKSKGLEIIKWAAIGYIGLQFVPFILGLLEMIGSELRNSL